MIVNLVSEESGELLDSFEVDDEEFARWEHAASQDGVTVEEFMIRAIKELSEQ